MIARICNNSNGFTALNTQLFEAGTASQPGEPGAVGVGGEGPKQVSTTLPAMKAWLCTMGCTPVGCPRGWTGE